MTDNHNRERERIVKTYRVRQTRQIIGIAAALFFVLLFAAVYKRPDLFGTYAKESLFAAQALCIAAFIGFTYSNWRCPACSSFLKGDIHRRRCNKCGVDLSKN